MKCQKLFNQAFLFDKRSHWEWIDWYQILLRKQTHTLKNVLSPELNLELPETFKAAIRKILQDRGVIE